MPARLANRIGGLRGIVLLTLALWLALRQVDGVLGYLQSTGSGGYGANDLYTVAPGGLAEHVQDLLRVWKGTRPVSHVAFAVYTALDVVFVGLYTLIFLLLFERLGAPEGAMKPIDRALGRAPLVVAILAGADLVEDAVRAVMVASASSALWLVLLAWFATTVKWVALATVLLLLVRAWQRVGLPEGPGRWTSDSWWALGRLRVPAFFVAAVGFMLVVDPTGQVRDSFRRWLDSPEQFLASAGFTVGGVALLGLAIWTTARRAVLGDYRVALRPLSPLRWALVAVVLAAVAWKLDLRNLAGPAVAIGAVAVLELWWILFGSRNHGRGQARRERCARKTRREAAAEPSEGRKPEVLRVARALSTIPLLALMLGLVSAWTAPPVVLLPLGHETTRAVLCVVFALATLPALVVSAWRVPALLRAVDGEPPSRLERRQVAVASSCLVVCIFAVLFPLDFPSILGPVGVTAVIVGLFVVVLGEGQRYSDTHAPSAGLIFVGFTRVPVLLLLLLALTVAALVDDGSYHSVEGNGGPAPDRAGTPLHTAFSDWSRRNCANAGGADRHVPMILVASQGGGIRAAYWTSSVLTEVLSPPPRQDADCPGATPFGSVFAMGGASGGSVGITSFTGHAADGGEWYREVMGDTDFVAVPMSWAFLVDLPRALVGFDGPDRQRRFEEVWEGQDESLEEDFFAGHSPDAPVLMLSATQVETGCRMNISPLRLTAPTKSNSQGECASLDRPPSAVDPPPPSPRPTAALTSDVLDFLCQESIERSTAALTSARFPYVSPSGRLTKCAGGRTIAVVDGGYAENTGGQPVLDLWARLRPYVAAHNRQRDAPRIVPVFVDVDNHYSKAARAGPGKRVPQLLVPPLTAARADRLDDRGVEQLANARFSTALPGAPDTVCTLGDDPGERFVRIAPPESPGVQAPLGWTLSQMSMNDLDRQRADALGRAPAENLRSFLAKGTIDCDPGAEY